MRFAIGDLVEYKGVGCIVEPARLNTIGIVSDCDAYSDPTVTVISPAAWFDNVGDELVLYPKVWKKIGRAEL